MNSLGFNMIFETERLSVRRYQAGDGENFFRMNGDEEIVRYIRPAKSREECDQFLLEVIKYSEDNPLFGRWAVNEKLSGSFVGTFAIIPVEGSSNFQVGYSLVKKAWGKGYASELTLAGTSYFFENTSSNELFALTESANIPSQKVLVKGGFIQSAVRPEGGKDVLEFVIKRNDFYEVKAVTG